MKTTSTALALILAASGTAQAQEVTYLSFGLGYTSYADEDFAIMDAEGEIEYRLNQFMFMADIDLLRFDDGTPDTLSEISFGAGYEVAPGALIWASFGQFNFGDESSNTAEIGAQYDAGAFAVALAYRTLDELDNDVYELVGTYNVNANTLVGLSVLRDDTSKTQTTTLFAGYDAGPLDVDVALASLDLGFGSGLTALNADMAYEFRGNFRALGGLSLFSGDGDDVTSLRVGAGYQVAQNTWLDASYETLNFGGGNSVDSIGVMLNFEMGGDRTLITQRASAARSSIYDGLGPEGAFIGTLGDFGFGGT